MIISSILMTFCLIQRWYCKEKLDACFSKELRVNNLTISVYEVMEIGFGMMHLSSVGPIDWIIKLHQISLLLNLFWWFI